jgi:hypothetical protein
MAYFEQADAKTTTDNSYQTNNLNLISLMNDKEAPTNKPQSDNNIASQPDLTHLTFTDLPNYSLSRTSLSTTAKGTETTALGRPVQASGMSTGDSPLAKLEGFWHRTPLG